MSESSSAKTSKSVVTHVSQLANIPLSAEETTALMSAFDETLSVIENLQEVDVAQLEPTHQVTGLTNVYRADEIDAQRQFTQEEALVNARETLRGYFVVPRILDTDD